MNSWFKRNSIHFLIAAIFLVICFAYFRPAFQGKTLGQGDVIGAQSTQKEINDYRARDTTILWTNQIYGGMPAFQIWAPYPDNVTTSIVNVLVTLFPNPLYIILLLLFGAYFLFSVLKLNPWIAAAGAVAFTFSSYNIILVAAGHTNQVFAIAFFAPILASIILILRGRYWLGSSLLALFLALEIRANHIQMTYYLLIAILILTGIELYQAIKNKKLPGFLKSLAFIFAATLIALLVNASLLWSTAEYGKDTIRGQSNLTQHTTEPSNGLPKTYAYEYSQTFGENLTFLVPNAYGGDTGLDAIDFQNSELLKALQGTQVNGAPISQQQFQALAQNLSTYWGDKPLTSGPHYFGAVICFLFIFGLFVVKNPLKWWLLATVLLTMFLSIGSSFPYVSDLFFNYFPLYNKFRAIESILAVTGLCVPILALLAVGELLTTTNKTELFKKLKISFYITGGLALVLFAVPEIFLSFKQSNLLAFTNSVSQFLGGNSQAANDIMRALQTDRENIERWDAFRSLIFISIAFGFIGVFIKQKINATVLSIVLFALILVDLWPVDKRYLKDESFQDKQDISQIVQPREVDNAVNLDKSDYRVFDLTHDFKRDTYSPFFHRSITGYSAARLKRYDELIDHQIAISPPNHDVLDMLNVKWVIMQDPKTGNMQSIQNQTACGNAWFVKSVKYATGADQEMQAISSFSPKDEAIVDQQYKKLVNTIQNYGVDPNATIKLVKYSPDDMVYQSGATANEVAVFSEIYYDKGWKMYIDGVEAPYFRADYVLRAASIPLGNHKVEFIFHPASYYTGEKISLAGSILLVLALGGAVYAETRKKKTEVKPETKSPVKKR